MGGLIIGGYCDRDLGGLFSGWLFFRGGGGGLIIRILR